MSRNTRSKATPKAKGGILKVAPWLALGVVAVALAAMAWFGGPERLLDMLGQRMVQTGNTVDLTIIHTNDSYGYVFPCG